MNLQLKGFCLSAGIHGVCLLLFVLLQFLAATPSKIAVIDFTFAGDTTALREPSVAPPAASEPRRVTAVRRKPMVGDPQPKKAPEQKLTTADETGPAPENPARTATETISPLGEEIAGPPRADGGDAIRDGSDHAGTVQSPTGRPVITPDQSRTVYLKEHFIYIRDRINRNILYPEMARKMGWCGQVKIAFVICEDGGVNDIRVVDSSGFGALDRNAVDTVKKVAPFPRPPVRAEIRMAVTYQLN